MYRIVAELAGLAGHVEMRQSWRAMVIGNSRGSADNSIWPVPLEVPEEHQKIKCHIRAHYGAATRDKRDNVTIARVALSTPDETDSPEGTIVYR